MPRMALQCDTGAVPDRPDTRSSVERSGGEETNGVRSGIRAQMRTNYRFKEFRPTLVGWRTMRCLAQTLKSVDTNRTPG